MNNVDSPFEYIDISEFCRTGSQIKRELKNVSEEVEEAASVVMVSAFEADLLKEQPVQGVSQASIAKWVEIFESHAGDESQLSGIISAEDANLNSDAAREEAELARRLARSQLNTIKVHNEEMMGTRMKNAVLSNSASGSPVSVEEASGGGEGLRERAVEDDVIISVTILPGGRPSLMHLQKQEIEFKATDSLASLPKEIFCLSKRLAKECFLKDASEEHLIESSAFVFMEGTFYDDPLDESCASGRPSDVYYEAFKAAGRYSGAAQVLLSNSAGVKRLSLKSCCWRDLKIRLNTPYLLVHLGGCEHIFYVTQIRHASRTDCRNLEFPHVSHAMRVRHRKCRICEVYAGTKMISNDKLMPENPCIICDKCFEGFHGMDRRWYSDFQVLPYYHDS